MSGDLISRAALMERLREMYPLGFSNDDVAYELCYAPAVDAEPVRHAAWERYPGPVHIRCTGCKVEFDESKMPFARNFCPNCGAKMDGDAAK